MDDRGQANYTEEKEEKDARRTFKFEVVAELKHVDADVAAVVNEEHDDAVLTRMHDRVKQKEANKRCR